MRECMKTEEIKFYVAICQEAWKPNWANHGQAAGERSNYYFNNELFTSAGRVTDQSVEMTDHDIFHIHIHAFVLERECKLWLQQLVVTLLGYWVGVWTCTSSWTAAEGLLVLLAQDEFKLSLCRAAGWL